MLNFVREHGYVILHKSIGLRRIPSRSLEPVSANDSFTPANIDLTSSADCEIGAPGFAL
jgi:hypothetical protein